MTDYYAILLVETEDESHLKEVFALHKGENTIGSDNDCDIVIQLDPNKIESFHAKIIVNDEYNDIGIEDISLSNGIYKEKNNKRTRLKKKREYEMFPKRNFYLSRLIKMFTIEGNLKEIEDFLEKNDIGFYKEYLLNKYSQFKEEEKFKDEENLSVEFEGVKESTFTRKRFNSEDFNNFEFVPEDENFVDKEKENPEKEIGKGESEDKYINKELLNFKIGEENKILSEVLEPPKNIFEILPLKDKIADVNFESGNERKDDIEKLLKSNILSERVKIKKKKMIQNLMNEEGNKN